VGECSHVLDPQPVKRNRLPEDSLRIEILDPDQYDKWNQFVDQSEQGSVFCYSWWLDAATKSNFRIYAVIEKNEIVAGFPAAMDAYNKINEPPLTRYLGVLYREKKASSIRKQASDERKWLKALLKDLQLKDIVQFCTHHSFSNWLLFRWKGLKQTTRYTYILDYRGKTDDDLWQCLSQSKKYRIKKAEKNGIKAIISDDLNEVYTLAEMSYKRQELKMKYSPADLIILDNAVKNNGNRLILKAIDDYGRIHAVVYVVYYRNTAYNLISGSNPALRGKGGHTLVKWEAVRYFLNKVDYFNFCGSDIRNIEEHVRGYGGTLTPYFHIYNERLIHYKEIRYHFKEMLFHLKSMVKAFGMKYLASRN